MFLKNYKPTSSGVRHKVNIMSFLLNNKTKNFFKVGYSKNSGRNKFGGITVRHKINKTNKVFYILDNLRNASTKLALVIMLRTDPNRNAFIALIQYSTGCYSYILAPHGVINGYFLKNTNKAEVSYDQYKTGYSVFLGNLTTGSIFFNLRVGKHQSRYAVSAGTYCIVLYSSVESLLVRVRLPSKHIMHINRNTLVVLGRVSNIMKKKEVIGKAGINVLKGFLPSVRGVAMNPVDHPHGGRTKTNQPELTPWGKIAKFKK